MKRLGKLAEHKEKKDDGVDSGCSAASPLLLLPKMNRNRKRKRGGLMIQQHLHNRPRISFFFSGVFQPVSFDLQLASSNLVVFSADLSNAIF